MRTIESAKEPFAYVLYIHSRTREFVSLHQSLDEAEEALRAYAGTIFVRLNDNEIVETLTDDGMYVRIFACAMERNTQISTELRPFVREAA
jgi:hypothetical protein